MSIAPHYAARQAFFQRLNAFVAIGCERWQRDDKKWRPMAELRPGQRPIRLKIPTFLREQCDEAAYKFWLDARTGSQNSEKVAMRTRRVFEQFLIYAERSRWFDATDVDELRTFFNEHYWPTERGWLQKRQSERERAELFADLGGPAIVARIGADPTAFQEWSWTVISDAYNGNNYQQALNLGETVVTEASALIERDFAEIDVPLALCAVQEVAYPATLARLNCWAPEPGALLQRLEKVARIRVPLATISGQARHLLARFATNAVALRSACARFEGQTPMQTTLADIHSHLAAIRFHQDIRRKVYADAAVGIDSTNITLMLAEVLEMRTDWLREFGLFRSMSEVPNFVDQARDLLVKALGDAADAASINDVLEFMVRPEQLVGGEWQAITTGEASRAGWNDAAVAALGAKSVLQEDNLDLDSAHTWIMHAKTRLDGCTNFLAWSDFYCACEAYMKRRGHPILCDYALNSVRKLQRSAGNRPAVEHFETTLLQIASRKKASPSPQTIDDTPLQWFLREEPPPLSRHAQ